uniref:Uncharacterized protein n=1 Tax=Meloidogyne hapla TaxID=6305 RepID=A0A1I8BTG6_MELHA
MAIAFASYENVNITSLTLPISSEKMTGDDMNKLPELLGGIVRNSTRTSEYNPCFWRELENNLPPLIVRRESLNEPFYEQIPSPSQSAFV